MSGRGVAALSSVLRGALAALAMLTCAATAHADPVGGAARALQMQTAFNPALPGAGEGVRVLVRNLKEMSGGLIAVKILEPGRIVPTPDMLDAVVARDLESAFTWSGYAVAKAPVFHLFATLPFGPGPEDLVSWVQEGEGGRIHREAYAKLGVAAVPCGVQGMEGGGWFRGAIESVADLKDRKLRFTGLAAESLARLGAQPADVKPGEFFFKLQQGAIDGGEMSTPAMDVALGFEKLGLPYRMPGWHQPSALIDFFMRRDRWEALSAAQRRQIETACRANVAWTLARSPVLQAHALERLAGAGIAIKTWSPALLEAFRRESGVVIRELAQRDPDFAHGLASQRAFVERNAAWRSIQRLP